MNLEDIKKYLEENAKNEEVIDFMKSIQQPITRDSVESWCKNDSDGKSWLDRCCDLYATKAVNTARENAIAKFKENELPKIIDDAIKKESNKGLTPDQLKIKELEEKMAKYESEKAEALRLETNRNKLKEVGMNTDLAKYIKTDDDIDFFKNLINDSVKAEVKNKLGNSSYRPPVVDNHLSTITKEQFNKMGYKERLKLYNEDKELYEKLQNEQ